MTPKSVLTCSILTTFMFSCTDIRSTQKIPSKSFIDTTAYPGKNFSSVVLFVLDSSQSITRSSSIDTTVFVYAGHAGYSFIDTSGGPKTKNYKSYELDSIQIKKLEHLLTRQPCKGGPILDKLCSPIYRHVFVFYDDEKKPMAQTHVCFQCELSKFFPYEDYMCDFDNKANFKDLKNFVDTIKQPK